MSDCIGDPEADTDNPVLKAEQDAQVKSFLFYLLFCLILFFSNRRSFFFIFLPCLKFPVDFKSLLTFRLVKEIVVMLQFCPPLSSITDNTEVRFALHLFSLYDVFNCYFTEYFV